MTTPDDIVPDDDTAIDALREMPTGTNDPNIVGDVGPTDVPPGSDPHDAGELHLTTGDRRPT